MQPIGWHSWKCFGMEPNYWGSRAVIYPAAWNADKIWVARKKWQKLWHFLCGNGSAEVSTITAAGKD